MELKGANQVNVAGIDNKRQITVLFCYKIRHPSTTLVDIRRWIWFLPKGVNFPDNWDVTYTCRMWKLTIRTYRPENNHDLDVFAAHMTDSLSKKLKGNNIQPVYVHVPAACTDNLQLLDVAVNYDYAVKCCKFWPMLATYRNWAIDLTRDPDFSML